MDARVAAWALLLLSALAMEVREVRASAPPRKLCGREFVLAVVDLCGPFNWFVVPQWPRANSDSPQPQQQEPPPLFAEPEDEDPAPQDEDRAPLTAQGTGAPVTQRPRRRKQELIRTFGSYVCCLHGCTRRDLVLFCGKRPPLQGLEGAPSGLDWRAP